MRDGADLPDWLPPLVAERARTILTAAAEAGSEPAIVSAIKRLTADPRMEGVWKYLQRKKRERSQRTQAYEYPVKDIVDGTWEPSRTFPAAFPTRAVYMQNLAMEVFYCHVLCTMTGGRINGFGGPWPTPTPTDEFVSQWCNFDRAKAKALRAEAKTISEVDRRIQNCPRELAALERRLRQAAEAHENLADASLADSERHVPAMITAQIARDLEALFGTKMCGQAATVASVVLEREVLTAEARAWCRHEGSQTLKAFDSDPSSDGGRMCAARVWSGRWPESPE